MGIIEYNKDDRQKISFACRQGTQPFRSFGGRVPSIKFIGKRAQFDKSVSAFASPVVDANTMPVTDKKTMSPMCDLELADIPADRWSRLSFSELEIETINQGTNEVADWKNISL